MKVLMFGWEFPPHITGGLGTACFGLTQALKSEGVEVIFVVPKAYGDESTESISLVNASNIKMKVTHHAEVQENEPITNESIATERLDEEEAPRQTVRTLPPPYKEVITLKKSENIEVIEVPANLKPYQTNLAGRTTTTVEEWNYTVFHDTPDEDTLQTLSQLEVTRGIDSVQAPPDKYYSYNFSGQYGQNLLTEIVRYAEVCAEIARRYDDVDVIHAHDWMTFPAGVAAKKVSGKPLLVHVHSTEFDRSGNTPQPEIFRIEKEGLDAADHVAAVSRWTKNILIDRYKIPARKITVSYNGIVQKNFETVADAPNIGTHVVTFLGRLTYQKGPLYFVQAAYKVLEKFPDAHFVVAGAGDMLPQMIELVAHLRLSSRFHFTGFLRPDSVEKVWAITNVYVMPSVSEPFGITPLEASQAGIPVIVSKQSGVAEVMSHAIKVDFWDADALAEAICNVLAYASLSSTLRKNSLAQIKRITWEKSAKKINTLYHELTA